MALRLFTVTALLLLSTLCFPQSRTADSLENLVKTVPADTTKVSLLNRLVTSLRENDINRALSHALKARELAEVLNDQKGLSLAMENLGWIYYRRGDYSKAFELSAEALRIVEGFNDQSAIARCLNNIAAIRFEQKQFDSAIENFKKAYTVSTQISDYTAMARSLNNIGYAFWGIEELDSAARYATMALKITEKTSNPYHSGFALRTLGDVAFQKGEYKQALEHFQRTLSLSRGIENHFLEISTLRRLGRTYARLNQLDRAIRLLNEDVALAMRFGYKEEMERAYKVLSELYVEKKNIDKAFEYQSKYLAIHDSIYSQRNSEQMALLQARFDSEMKETKIELLTKDASLKQEQINSQRVWMYFYIGCLSLVAILAFVLFYNNRIRKKVNLDLEAKNNSIQLQALQLTNLNITKDKLFSIISHDLRSPLASLRGLIDLVISGSLAQDEFMEVSRKLKKNLDSVNDDLDNLLLWAQSQLRGLQINAEELSIKPILDDKIQLFRESAKGKGIAIMNELDEDLVVLADKNHFGLVMRNLLANAIKFSRPGGSIFVRQRESGEYVEISVTDSGVGMGSSDLQKLFHAETHFSHLGTNQEKGAGIGLLLVKEFVEKNGGAIWVTSELGKGSTFTFTLKRCYALATSQAV
jgi:signal transduction histidine kinase